MRYLFKTIAIIFLLTTNFCCHYQQIMRTVKDAQKLQTNKKSFIGKPLKNLLKEVGPEIKMVFVEPDRADGALSYIMFKFVDREGQKIYNREHKIPLGITVFVKEKFEWDKSNKPLAEREKWTKEDEKKYGNLTVLDIRVYGED